MKPAQGIVVTLLTTLVIATTQIPANLLDPLLRNGSRGMIRLADAEGTLWHGSGRLASPDNAAAAYLAPWLTLSWNFDLAALPSGKLRWRILANQRPATNIEIGWRGVELVSTTLALPARPLAEALPHPALQLGWNGTLSLNGERLSCAWAGGCEGRLNLDWIHASGALWPHTVLGNYSLSVGITGQTAEATLSSAPHNTLILNGIATFSNGHAPKINIDVDGSTDILATLPGLLHGYANPRPDGTLNLAM